MINDPGRKLPARGRVGSETKAISSPRVEFFSILTEKRTGKKKRGLVVVFPPGKEGSPSHPGGERRRGTGEVDGFVALGRREKKDEENSYITPKAKRLRIGYFTHQEGQFCEEIGQGGLFCCQDGAQGHASGRPRVSAKESNRKGSKNPGLWEGEKQRIAFARRTREGNQ